MDCHLFWQSLFILVHMFQVSVYILLAKFTRIFISKSKEFVDALSLPQHASRTLEGSRAEHLGLHKALCWLMGWSSEIAPNGLWVRMILPPVEVLALKEDLIIWPSVLIIHNSSIAIDKRYEGVAISCEKLEAAVRGKPCLCCNYELPRLSI